MLWFMIIILIVLKNRKPYAKIWCFEFFYKNSFYKNP